MRNVIFGVLLLAVSVSLNGQTPAPAQAPAPAARQAPAQTSAPTAAPAPAPAATQAPAGNAQNGKKLYVSYGCYGCHNYQAQGGLAGARLAPHPIAFPAFLKYVRHPTNQMPPYTQKLVTDQELADIHAFLQTIPAPPALSSLPLLNQ